MKFYLLTILSIIFVCFGFSQSNQNENTLILKRLSKIEKVNDELITKIYKDSLLLDSLLMGKNTSEESLGLLIKNASNTIDMQDKVISVMELKYNYLFYLLAFITIGFPIFLLITNFFPTQKLNKEAKSILIDFEKKINTKISEHIKSNRNEQINKALIDIQGEDSFLKENSLNFLYFSINLGFSDEQLFKIYKILTSTELDLNDNNKLQLINCLCFKKNEYSESYFKDTVINAENSILRHRGLTYFVNSGIESYMNIISDMILDDDSPIDTYRGMLLYLSSTSLSGIIPIINYKELNEALNNEEKEELISELKDLKYDKIRKKIKKSYLFENVNKK